MIRLESSLPPIVIIGALVLVPVGCSRRSDMNRALPAATPANANSGRDTVDRAAIVDQLMRIEQDWTRILKTHDAEAMRQAYADDVVLIYPDGSLGNKETELQDLQSGVLTFDSWDFVDTKVQVLDANAAVVTGHSVLKNGKQKSADGKTIDLSGEYRFTDVFVKRNNRWQIVTSQATTITSPESSSSPAATVRPTNKPTMQ
jgi:ketosteroid isomerase-like protein